MTRARDIADTQTSADINGGTIDGATIGGSSAAAGTFTTVTSTSDSEFNGVDVGRGAGNKSTNTAVGASALASNTTGGENVAIGNNAFYTNTTGAANAAVGRNALYFNNASFNTAMGYSSVYNNTSGTQNSGFGGRSLQSNTTGSYNTAVGFTSLYSNTTASNNTAVGYQAGYSNTTGTQNTFVGNVTGYANITGNWNTALGQNAARSITTGAGNTCLGQGAGYGLTTGTNNTFVGARNVSGYGCGELVTTGSKNTILGGYNGNQGGLDIRTSSNRIVLSDGDGNIGLYIDDQKRTHFGRTTSPGEWTGARDYKAIDNYDGARMFSGRASTLQREHHIFTNPNGTVGSITTSGSATAYNTSSDYRLKEDWQPMSGATERLKQLKPVNFAWKVDGSRVDGFLAHEAAEVVPECVSGEKDAVDDEGNPIYQGIDQSKLVPLLVATIQELEARIAALEETP
jgi:hypothetical protein